MIYSDCYYKVKYLFIERNKNRGIFKFHFEFEAIRLVSELCVKINIFSSTGQKLYVFEEYGRIFNQSDRWFLQTLLLLNFMKFAKMISIRLYRNIGQRYQLFIL